MPLKRSVVLSLGAILIAAAAIAFLASPAPSQYEATLADLNAEMSELIGGRSDNSDDVAANRSAVRLLAIGVGVAGVVILGLGLAIPTAAQGAGGIASKARADASKSDVRNSRTNTAAAAAWHSIRESLDEGDYVDFIAAFSGTAEAMLASRHRRLLSTWQGLDKSNAVAVGQFLEARAFPALAAKILVAAEAEALSNPSMAACLDQLRKQVADQEAERALWAAAGFVDTHLS